ncbi:RNA polymerase sigma factor [Litoribacter populi]|uniref:RNA polymerase sigma factor n=1 Tax=Litoribacter populi TaxID=2598460 RepID=UPI00118027E7|nr:sigma-70 family RNA polymerase sigma factor [Litoribacter populi]
MVNSAQQQNMWRGLREGKRSALKDIYELYFDDLHHYGCCMCQDLNLVEDAIQDVFVDLHHYRENLSPTVNPKAYLISCLRRKLLANIQKFKAFSLKIEKLDLKAEESLEKELISEETDERILLKLKLAMEKLSARQKEIIFLKFVKNMNYDDIADIMQMSVSSCRTLMYRTSKNLREELQEMQILQNPTLQKSSLSKVLQSFLPLLF